jgi:3-phenylpropionate/trans-cinnamate dioxygenase ferredoxin subunit
VTIEGRSIAIFNVGGEYFALLDRCPHRGGSLYEGKLTGLVQSTKPGTYVYSRPGEILRCPWHGWEFDIRTGKSHCDPERVRAKSFPVAIEAGSELTEKSYAVETFPVSVEHEYVVLTT